MQGYLICSEGLSETASRTATSFSNEVIGKGFSRLKLLWDEFNSQNAGFINEFINIRLELAKINGTIEKIIDELTGFYAIVKQLKMMGISTKIESARLGVDGQDFFALAENVDKLAELIHEKASTISKKVSKLSIQINKTIEELFGLEKARETESDSVLNNTSLSMSYFEKKQKSSINRIEKIVLNTERIHNNIGSVVTSIQFHDITRQQLEHVIEIINDISAKLEGLDEQDEKEVLTLVHDVSELQAAQLDNSLEGFQSAVQNIITSLQNVEENVSGIFRESVDLLSEKENNSTLYEVKKELESITEGIKKEAVINDRLTESISGVVEVVAGLPAYISEIEEIGTQIEILALNSIIKAAHIKSGRSALGVLAEAIQKLSIEAKSRTGMTTDSLSTISGISQNLKSYLGSSAVQATDGNEISGVLDSMIHSEKESDALIVKFKTDVNTLHLDIVSTKESISVHQKAISCIGEAVTGLKEIIRDIYSSVEMDPLREKNISQYTSKYSMNIERKIHQDLESNTEHSFQNDLSFGDNVELF